MRIKCIAIEDEPLALEKITGFINKIDFLELTSSFSNAIDGLNYLKSNQVDLIFLDIKMPDFSGLQFLESLNPKPKVIIASAYEQYAIKGYELDVSDYLLKPFSFERFVRSINKVYNQITEVVDSFRQSDYIFIKTEYRIEKVAVNSIRYIEGQGDYLKVITDDKKLMTLLTFKKLLNLLSDKTLFARVHKSYIVAINKIDCIERNRIIIDSDRIPISNSYKDDFYRILKERNMYI